MNKDELDENEPIDPNDPEKGLDKFVKRNEERNQKDYEENKYANRELQRRQQEQKRIDDILKERPGETSIQRRERISREMGRSYKGKQRLPSDADIQTEGNLKGEPTQEEIFRKKTPEEIAEAEEGAKKARRIIEQGKKERGEDYDPNFAFEGNLGASIAFEVGANTLLDLFTPVLPLQSGGSYVINLISQIIRDPSNINSLNQLEAGAAATSSLIPGANQYAAFLKGVKPATRGTQVVRQVGRGIVDANINVAGERIGSGQELTEKDIALATGIGGTVGVFLPRIVEEIGKDPTDFSKIFRNIRKRLDGGPELATVDGFPVGQATPEFEPTTAFAIKGKGEGLTPDEIKKATDVSQDEFNKSLQPKSKLEAGTDLETIKKDVDATNQFNQKQYDLAKKFVFEFDEAQPFKVSKSEIRKMKVNARRKLKLKDVKKVQAKLNDPNITDEVVQRYYDDAVRSELGYTGTAGTLDFLNLMSDAPSRKAFTSVDEFIANSRVSQSSIEDILDDMSFKLETPISKEKLQNLLDGTETYSFRTTRMKKKGEAPILINDIKSLQKAYFARLLALEDIAEFEKGHINAVDQILERFYRGEKITPTASFKDNTNPEIARSIYKLVGNEAAFDAMADINKDYIVKGLTDRDLKFAQVFAGNRSRKANQDLDRVVNSVFGTEPDLESSLLAYVYPERSLNAMVAPDMKVTFAKVFMKEFDEQVQAILDLGGKMENIGPQRIEVMRQRALKTTLESFPPDLSKDMGKMLTTYLKANKINVVDEFGEAKF